MEAAIEMTGRSIDSCLMHTIVDFLGVAMALVLMYVVRQEYIRLWMSVRAEWLVLDGTWIFLIRVARGHMDKVFS